MSLSPVLLAFFVQGKIAPIEAFQLIERGNACIVVKPAKGDLRNTQVTVIRLIWGSGLKPGDRIRLKGYVFRDYTGFPNEENESDYMNYTVERPSLVFLQPPPKGISLRPEERFAEWPMIGFSQSRRDCYRNFRGRLAVGGVLFNPSMTRQHPDSVSLDEVVQELKRIRAYLKTSP